MNASLSHHRSPFGTPRALSWAIGVSCLLAAAAAPAQPATDTVVERYADGGVKTSREVRLDREGNYVNHGVWRRWDARGELIGQGRYEWGEREGRWTRWATADAAPLLATEPFRRFQPPFSSQADFRAGRLDGVWAVFDADGRPVSEVHFADGRRHGAATLWLPSGEVSHRSEYVHDAPHGAVEAPGPDGRLAVVDTYVEGRRRFERVERHADGRPKSRDEMLGPAARLAAADSFWELRFARYETTGTPIRHGERRAWAPNGRPLLHVMYERGRAVGEAKWWRPNGQLAVRGYYRDGVAEGAWTWWHQNGARAAEVNYAAGRPTGEPICWAPTGRRVAAEAVARHQGPPGSDTTTR